MILGCFQHLNHTNRPGSSQFSFGLPTGPCRELFCPNGFAQIAQGLVGVVADNYVVENLDAQDLSRPNQADRDISIGSAGLWVATGVVVRQNEIFR